MRRTPGTRRPGDAGLYRWSLRDHFESDLLVEDSREHRHHVLSHLRRQRHRRHGARPGARHARPRGPLHHLRQSDPPGPRHAAHSLSRSGGLQLSAVPVPAVLPGAGLAHGGGGGDLQPRPAARALRDSALDLGDAGAADAGAQAAAAVHHHAARHRYHAGGRRPLLLPDHQILDREIGRHHVDQRGPAQADGRGVRRRRTRSASSRISSTAICTIPIPKKPAPRPTRPTARSC